MTGLARDVHKLAVARELGADQTIVVDEEDVVTAVREATNGIGVDVVVDTTPGALQPILDGIEAVRPGGRIVLAGLNHDRPIQGLNTDRLIVKEIRLQGVRTARPAAFATALEILASGRYPLERMATHAFGLDEAETAIRTLVEDPTAIGVCLTP